MTLSPLEFSSLIGMSYDFSTTGDTSKIRDAAKQLVEKFDGEKDLLSWLLLSFEPYEEKYPGLLSEVSPMCAAWFQLERMKYPHFSLSPDFFNAIALTDFGDFTDEPMYMPFDAFTVSFPKTDFLAGASRMIIYKLPKVTINTDTRDVTTTWKLYQATLCKESSIFTRWPIGMTRKEMNVESENLDGRALEPGTRPIDDWEKPLPRRMRNLLINMLTYIEAQGPLPTVPRARKNPVPAPVELLHPERPLFDVGRTVKLDGRLRKALLESSGDRERWHVSQRYVVRGHWRNQAYGEGRTLRRRQWIEPHWKGSENAVEAITRTYEVT